ncbi:rRNA biogenesis protein rrp5 [uncultured Megasphaera sp.]|jgi:hypothetical protein|uniref:rRNA biogenesis protein rrp5 n=1 Tax=uncultured Megasphaera sp. TaxID=165188 RepID=UPI0027DB01DB|nr:rRNA biogenesis protein rrp5 [uncultured Megasphaera sp.]
MGKTDELSNLADELQQCAKNMIRIADKLCQRAGTSAKEEKKAGKKLSLEEVRAMAADKARQGFTQQVRELINKYGADKLSAMDPKHYRAFLAEVEVLGNAG